MTGVDFSEFEFIGKTLLDQRWIFAKTMPENPHWYTLRKVTFDLRRRDGQWQTLSREAYDRGNGAALLLYDSGHGDTGFPSLVHAGLWACRVGLFCTRLLRARLRAGVCAEKFS